MSTPDSLTGRSVQMPNDTCRCGSNVVVIHVDRRLHCRSCGRPRGFLTSFTAQWISAVIATLGADSIVIRGPKL
jgi:ribosomal protein S27AE